MSKLSTVPKTAAKCRCPVCDDDKPQSFLEIPYINFTSRIRAGSILHCSECGLYFLNPYPTEEDIDELYRVEQTFSQEYINPYQSIPFFQQFEKLFREFGDDTRFIVKTSLRHAPKDPLVLDIGCSSGNLLSRFRDLAPTAQLFGIDIDPGAKEKAPGHLKDRIWIGDPLDYPEDRKFDVITMKFVIEHLRDPLGNLRKIRKLLKPGGCFFACTPDISSRRAKRLGAKWEMISHPDQKLGHCVWYDHTTMRKILAKAGFKVEQLSNRGPVIEHASPFVRKALETILGTDSISGRFISNFHLRIIWAILIDGWCSESVGWGDMMYAFSTVSENSEGAF